MQEPPSQVFPVSVTVADDEHMRSRPSAQKISPHATLYASPLIAPSHRQEPPPVSVPPPPVSVTPPPSGGSVKQVLADVQSAAATHTAALSRSRHRAAVAQFGMGKPQSEATRQTSAHEAPPPPSSSPHASIETSATHKAIRFMRATIPQGVGGVTLSCR